MQHRLQESSQKAETKLQLSQSELYKLKLKLSSLEKLCEEQHAEIARLKTNTKLGESVAKLPAACVDSLVNAEQIKEVKQSALHSALNELRGADKSRDDLLAKLESLEARQKKAYVQLYERVGGEINARLKKTVGEYEKEIQAQVDRDRKLSATELEMERLRGGSKEAAQFETLDDLFRKYNV